MPVVNVTLGKRSFQMACAAGEEARLHELAAAVDTRVLELEGQLGSGNETMLLAMTTLMLQDELEDAKKGVASEDAGKLRLVKQEQEQVMTDTLDAISDHLEGLVDKAGR